MGGACHPSQFYNLRPFTFTPLRPHEYVRFVLCGPTITTLDYPSEGIMFLHGTGNTCANTALFRV